MTKSKNRKISFLLTGALALSCICPGVWSVSAEGNDSSPAEEYAASYIDYTDYLAEHQDKTKPAQVYTIDVTSYDREKSQDVSVEKFDGRTAVLAGEHSLLCWQVEVPQAGLYQLALDYLPTQGRGGAIERRLKINGVVPYAQADSLVFRRIWKDESEAFRTDANGNELLTTQVEAPEWQTVCLGDALGYEPEPLYFYFEQGLNTLELEAVKEPMAIAQLRLCQAEQPLPYEAVLKEYEEKGYQQVGVDAAMKQQAEHADKKSDATLYATEDRTSPLTDQTDISKIKLNVIGGTGWSGAGDWISYQIEVSQSGLYELAFRFKQNEMEGNVSYRKLTINGKVPFAEAACLAFPYDEGWQVMKAGGEQPYLFYLEAGKPHTITLECTLGEMAAVIKQAQRSIAALNEIYRKLKMIVGSFPDPNRDYEIDKQVPDCIPIFTQERENIHALAQEISQRGDGKSDYFSLMQKLVLQLDDFIKDSESIPLRLDKFSSNISSFAELTYSAAAQPLMLDYFMLTEPGAALPKADAGFFEKLLYEIQLFFQSFFSDYNSLSTGGSLDRHTEIWVTTGRDQAEVIRGLAENTFTQEKGIGVSVRLVKEDAMLPAVAANCGPDVAIGQARALPVDYGLRSAVLDLSEFSDLADVLPRFNETAVEPFRVGEQLYALPDQELFMMMFCRMDVLSKLGLEVPQTWDDLFEMLNVLHQNNLDIGLPNVQNFAADQLSSGLEIYCMLLYQNGGVFYNDTHTATRLSDNEAIAAFEEWASLYTKYKISTEMNHLTRFRSGEAPIVIQPLSFYNTLTGAAPELRGLWEMLPVLGTERDGKIDRSVINNVTGSVIFANTQDKDASWEFLKWWTSADTQAAYSNGMEARQGVPARVSTANLEAFNRLPWAPDVLAALNEQRAHIRSFPEVPGGYMVNRSISTAIRTTISNGGNGTEILLDRNDKINNEIALRRKEFGLE